MGWQVEHIKEYYISVAEKIQKQPELVKTPEVISAMYLQGIAMAIADLAETIEIFDERTNGYGG